MHRRVCDSVMGVLSSERNASSLDLLEDNSSLIDHIRLNTERAIAACEVKWRESNPPIGNTYDKRYHRIEGDG